MMTRYDPWVNMLRTTVAAFAAGAGGADAITVLPFDSALGQSDDFARRIARNTSPLLMEESHVAKVSDPAAGSYAVEQLTDELARAAWTEFGLIEEVGGVLAAFSDVSAVGSDVSAGGWGRVPTKEWTRIRFSIDPLFTTKLHQWSCPPISVEIGLLLFRLPTLAKQSVKAILSSFLF